MENLCDRVAIVREGRIVADERVQSLRERALRTVELVFRDEEAAAQATPPACFRPVRREGRIWQGELDGPSPPIVRWAAEQPLDDITISQPDLETLFRKYYDVALEPR